MSDDLVQRLRDASLVIQYPERSKIADRIEALEAENQKLHGWVQSAEQAAGTLQRKANAYESRIEVLETELAVCREAIEVCLDVAERLPSDDDGDAAVRRCTLRRLNEAIGKAVPRLMRERPEGQKLYGLNYMEMRGRIEALEAANEALEATLERQQISYERERDAETYRGDGRCQYAMEHMNRMEQLLAFCDWERKHNPHPQGNPHVAEWAAAEIERLRATLERQQLDRAREREIDQEEIERLIALRRDDARALARMRALIADAEVLAEYGRDDGLRDRVDVGAWLSPGDRIVVQSLPPQVPNEYGHMLTTAELWEMYVEDPETPDEPRAD